MKRTFTLLTIAIMWLLIAVHAPAQQQLKHQPRSQQQLARTQPYPPAGVYQRRQTWYEFLLRQFNPSDFDYGQWIEQRRQAFWEARLRNPYFGYSFGVTVALLLIAGVCAKLWIDHRHAMCITAEMMADIYNHDQYSREVARQAIQKYNDHIERCNRAVEAAAQGIATPATGSDAEGLRAELQRVADERDRYMQERDIAKTELETKGKVLAELSLRLDGMSSKPGTTGNSQSSGVRTSDPVVVQHINNLQEQLYVERQKNRQLKGA